MLTTMILAALMAGAPAKSIDGDGTTLAVQVTAHPVYDGDTGKTHLRLTRGKDVRMEVDWDGIWRVLSHDPQKHRYVLSGEFQQGGWLPVRRIRYLDERSTKYVESRYSDGDFLAFAAVPAPDGRWVAFVGVMGDGPRFRLLLLDTHSDTMVELGDPPAPPPSTDVAPKDLSADCGWTSWPCFHDSWVDLERKVVAFEGSTLRVSYGDKDSPQRRDPNRTTKTWDLEKMMRDAGVGKK